MNSVDPSMFAIQWLRPNRFGLRARDVEPAVLELQRVAWSAPRSGSVSCV